MEVVLWTRSSMGAPAITMLWSHRWEPWHDAVLPHQLGWRWIYPQWFFLLLLRLIHLHRLLIICHDDRHCSSYSGTPLSPLLWFQDPILCCPTEPSDRHCSRTSLFQPSLGITITGAWKLSERWARHRGFCRALNKICCRCHPDIRKPL